MRQACSFPGCERPGAMLAVGEDVHLYSGRQRPEDVKPRVHQAAVCDEHRELVRRGLQERHQPRSMRIREGRP